MRRAYWRMWRVVPCASRKSLRTDSWKDCEEILKSSKLATINEEPENCEDTQSSSPPMRLKQRLAKKGKKKKGSKENSSNNNNNKVGNFRLPHFSIKDSYALFMTRFKSKGRFGGLLQY